MRMCKTQSIHWASIHTPVAGCLLLDDWQCGSGDESPHGYEETWGPMLFHYNNMDYIFSLPFRWPSSHEAQLLALRWANSLRFAHSLSSAQAEFLASSYMKFQNTVQYYIFALHTSYMKFQFQNILALKLSWGYWLAEGRALGRSHENFLWQSQPVDAVVWI